MLELLFISSRPGFLPPCSFAHAFSHILSSDLRVWDSDSYFDFSSISMLLFAWICSKGCLRVSLKLGVVEFRFCTRDSGRVKAATPQWERDHFCPTDSISVGDPGVHPTHLTHC
jgi:hypothetical protein